MGCVFHTPGHPGGGVWLTLRMTIMSIKKWLLRFMYMNYTGLNRALTSTPPITFKMNWNWLWSRSYHPLSMLDPTSALVADWEQIPAGRFQNLVEKAKVLEWHVLHLYTGVLFWLSTNFWTYSWIVYSWMLALGLDKYASLTQKHWPYKISKCGSGSSWHIN